MKRNYYNLEFYINNRGGYSFNEWCKCMKAKYSSLSEFIINNKMPNDLIDFLEEIWDQIIPLTFHEAISAEQNKKPGMFHCLGPAKIFKASSPTLVDKQTITKKRYGWDDNNNKFESVYDDTYELYNLDQTKLGFVIPSWNVRGLQAVRCFCPSSNKEYWIMVRSNTGEGFTDAIEAIAWTIQIDVKNPERIYRQGDVIIVKVPENAVRGGRYPLSKEQYLNLIYSET